METTSTSPASAGAKPGARLPIVSPSLLSCDFARIGAELARAEAAGADWHHVDVMDGHFVPNLTLGPPVVASIHGAAKIPLDVHLMIEDPVRFAPDFVKAGAHVLTFHREVCADDAAVRSTIAAFRDAGVERVGIALNPDMEIESVADHLSEVDLVLVMSVFPGFGGQAFLPDVLSKVRWLRERGYAGYVEMDGGLNANTIPSCAAAGADCLVSGSALYGADDMNATLAQFRQLAVEATERA